MKVRITKVKKDKFLIKCRDWWYLIEYHDNYPNMRLIWQRK
jgi:hypothetical protein